MLQLQNIANTIEGRNASKGIQNIWNRLKIYKI